MSTSSYSTLKPQFKKDFMEGDFNKNNNAAFKINLKSGKILWYALDNIFCRVAD